MGSAKVDEYLPIRLSGGSGEHEGLIEVFHGRVWGKICANNQWKSESSDVVCRHLGYDHAFVIYYDDTFSNNMTFVQYDQVDCAGSETNLTSCTSYRYEEGYCKDSAGEGAGVTCVSSEAPEVRVRLEGGNGSHQGLVEIFVRDDWRKVCSKGFSFNRGDVVCRSLGYNRAFMVMEDGSMVFSIQNGTAIFIDKLVCTGEEHDITECRAYRLKERFDSTYGPAAVFCEPGESLNVRLVGGRGSYEGRVEISLNGSWTSICAKEPWIEKTSAQICRVLGFEAGDSVAFYDDNRFGNPEGDFHIDTLECKDEEPVSITKTCRLRKFQVGYCDGRYASLQCDERK
ncbi:neurotrypsin-like [Lytechinus variegatus]|uniref:neurotrypsin-like n=1 Tax=Lytechinus variegatus TaxID=7654 RepID=UPI001BB20C49|nr:neurotrypsin-like [Lytechinus variegatus]